MEINKLLKRSKDAEQSCLAKVSNIDVIATKARLVEPEPVAIFGNPVLPAAAKGIDPENCLRKSNLDLKQSDNEPLKNQSLLIQPKANHVTISFDGA